MGLYFRKVFKFGPARVSVSSRGVGFSIGGEKTRIGVDALGRPYAATEIAGVCLRSAAGGNCPAAKQKSAAAGSIAGHTQARLVPGPLPAQAVFSGSAGYGREAPANAGGIRFQGGGKTIYWRFSTARRVVFIVFGALVSTAGYFPLALLFAYTLARGSPSVPLGFAAAVLLLAGAGLFAAQSGVVIHDGSA
jgi:hypothetical protein